MKNKRLALVLAAIVFLIAIIIALWAILSGVLKGNQPSPQVSGSNIAQVVSSSESSSSVASSSSASTSSESQSSESKASGEEKSTTVTFKFYVHGEIIGSFDVPNAAGKTVFEAIKSNKEIRFNYNEEDYPNKIVLVLGNEGSGIRKKVREHCDKLIKIPMFGQINSLNVSVASGILLSRIVNK